MSFADLVREELTAIAVKKPCCRRSAAYGYLLGARRDGEGQALFLPTEQQAIFAEQVLRRQFGKPMPIEKRIVNRHASYCVSLKGTKAESAALRLQSADLEQTAADEILELSCDACRAAFLRSVFLVGATVNDPRKSFHIEFSIPHESEPLLAAFLDSCGYEPKRMERAGGVGLYYKGSASVEELITLMGAARSAMEIINARIEREIRNQENRATNCVAKNIEKSVSAASRQMAAIEKLTLSGMLAQLPEGIRHTALLRAENPDATLEELRMLHEPPITKSGLNHRLQKILDAADQIKL